jgi:hypothetical protein
MTMTFSPGLLGEKLISKISNRTRTADRDLPGTSRRGFLGGAAVVGAALAVNPWGYLVKPASAYDAVCGNDAGCGDGYSVFCCTINNGANSCPPNTFIGGWWKADNSSFCGGSARYYVDCNAFKGGPWQCRCAEGTCDQRRVACNQFRYGQCSLEVSAAQTGPVVCRTVTCTPPWQQFAGVCSSSSATDNRTATHSAPCIGGSNPIGNVDGVSYSGNNTVRITGWSYDRDQPSTELSVAIFVDGTAIGWFPTGALRPDVNSAFGIPGNHGFDISIPMNPGRHSIQVNAINVGGGNDNPVIGGGSVRVGLNPIGNLDSLTGLDGAMILRGWAYDPDEPGTEIKVAVYVDGVPRDWYPTGQPRPDVNQVFGIPGNHGFDITVDAAPGQRTAATYGINVGGGDDNPKFGGGGTTVGFLPWGHIDGIGVSDHTVRISGWTYDPDQPSTPIQVAVYRGGQGIGWFPTGVSRPDVNSALNIPGNHGFDITLTNTPPGNQSFALYAINVGRPGINPLLGTTSIQVGA